MERLCEYAVQCCTSQREKDEVLVKVYRQLMLSRALAPPIAEYEMGRLELPDLESSIRSIKKFREDKTVGRFLRRAVMFFAAVGLESRRLFLTLPSEASSWDNDEGKLTQAYDAVFGSNNTPRRDWVSMGFQGKDPTTDFRATGAFGVACFHAFATGTPAEEVRQMLEQSGSLNNKDLTMPWYSLALVSVHMSQHLISQYRCSEPRFTYLVVERLVAQGSANTRGESEQGVSEAFRDTVLRLHRGLLTGFHRHWLREVASGAVRTVLDCEQSIQRYYEECPP
ncbi:hypothetical protein TRVA0_007S01552 [Trichomonascus vanleenenianus]|uniref:ELMO domain-containing protein n=1 Tax=Trichomonascus vanleenenianus TaxID=2268995 RepID=UPI003ECA18D4